MHALKTHSRIFKMIAIGIVSLSGVMTLSQNSYAEMDPNKLNEILSQLSQAGDSSSTSTTGSSTGTSGGSSSTSTSSSVGGLVSSGTSTHSSVSNASGSRANTTTTTSSSAAGNTPSGTNNTTSTTPPARPQELPSKEPASSTNTTVIKKPTTTAPVSFRIVRVETKDQKATFTFTVQNETSDIRKFAFTYTDNSNKSNKVLTYEKSSIKNSKGEYVWYISNLDLTKYSVKIAWVNEKGEEISGVVSKTFEADLSLYAAGRCMVPDVSGISLTFHNTFTTLDWEKAPGASKYKIYKKNAKGEYVFVDETDKNTYIIQVSEGKVRYDDFSIKAVCQDGAESTHFSPSVRVKTGPGEIALLWFLSIGISALVMFGRKKYLTRAQ